jgi:hypothetical protein
MVSEGPAREVAFGTAVLCSPGAGIAQAEEDPQVQEEFGPRYHSEQGFEHADHPVRDR